MALRKPTRNVKGSPKKESANPPEVTDKLTQNKARSAAASKNAKKNGLGGKVTLTKEQSKRKAASTRKKQFKPSEEAEIKAFWESGEYTLKELAERYDRNADSLSRYFSNKGIDKGSKAEEFAKQINDKIIEELLGDAGEMAKKVRHLKDDYLSRFDVIKRLAHNEMATVQKNKLPMQAALPNLRSIKEYAAILITCRTEEYDLLGVADFESRIEHDDLPELIVSELTVKDIERMRQEQIELSSLDEMSVGMESEEDDNEVIDES